MAHSWTLVAAVYNLEVAAGMRDGPYITANRARAIGLRALRNLRAALAKRGVTAAEFDAYMRMRDAADARMHDNLSALLPAAATTRDDADPVVNRSLRRLA